MSAGGHAGAPPEEQPGDARQRDRAVDRHPAAGAGRGAVRRPARRAGRDRPAQRRGPGLRQQAELRSEPVRRRHRRRELEGAQRIARQAAAEPRAARHLSARLDLQAVHGAGGADARQAHAAADDLRPRLLQLRQPHASATTRKAATARSTCTSRSSSRATPTTTCSPTTSASTRCTTSWRRSASASITGIDMQGELRGMLPSTEWKRTAYRKKEAAEVVRRRDDLARHRPGLQRVHDAAAGAGRRRRSPPAASASRRTWCARSRTTRRRDARPLAVASAAAAATGSPSTSRSSTTRCYGVTQEGTSARVVRRTRRYKSGGKTGTAQVIEIKANEKYNAAQIDERHRDHALYTAFAPLEEPQHRARAGRRERRLRRRRRGADRAPRLRLPARRASTRARPTSRRRSSASRPRRSACRGRSTRVPLPGATVDGAATARATGARAGRRRAASAPLPPTGRASATRSRCDGPR